MNPFIHRISVAANRFAAEENIRPAAPRSEPEERETEGNIVTDQQGADTTVADLTQFTQRNAPTILGVGLILLKLLTDNFIIGCTVIFTVSTFRKINDAFDLEQSLKDRSNAKTFAILLLLSVLLLFFIVYNVHLLQYNDNLYGRLVFQSPENELYISLFSTLWVCILTDSIVQIALLATKLLISNVFVGIAEYRQYGKLLCRFVCICCFIKLL
jgi:hypothetical protein